MSPSSSQLPSSKSAPSPTKRQPSPSTSHPPQSSSQVHYTVFIRLPFPRAHFTEPPASTWSASRDRQLWKLISTSGGNAGKEGLDWERLAKEFDVELEFLLMQAAWLSERHMERMRRIVPKMGGEKMERGESGGRAGDSKVAASIITPLASGVGGDGADSSIRTLASAAPPPFSRTPSGGTVTQSKVSAHASRNFRGSSSSGRRPVLATTHDDELQKQDALDHEGAVSSSSESEEAISRRSPAFRRPLMSASTKKIKQSALATTLGSDGDCDDDDYSSGGGYLPFASTTFAQSTEGSTAKDGSAATLRKANVAAGTTSSDASGSATATASSSKPQIANTSRFKNPQPAYSESSPSPPASSIFPPRTSNPTFTAPKTKSIPPPPSQTQRQPNTPSKTPTEAEYHSPTSIGSSFSDLEDAGVTRSALEEAVMSNVRGGTWSGISAAGGGGGAGVAGGRVAKGLRDVLGGGGGRR
ncbi:unnamed protein product [Zymoseptoria tritici ST99CH_1E4]|uniref:Autophagy-related protein 29 n=1 Tax=Zymoseptoria tritici ST99CH_1E4 TaxID=1276532 RepID=A0A2H1H8J5_ZYMTR|nr:unnamed protein product [Zymoseptoria tritici ST99CH_1E4]